METNKIIGYMLLVIGLAIIIFTAWQSYAIFSGKTSSPLVFRTQVQSSVVSSSATSSQKQIAETVSQQVKQIISAESVTKILNLFSWSFLAGILIMAGGAISGIGVKLINGKQ